MSSTTEVKPVLKFYSSGHIFHFGTANVIVCGRVDNNKIFCEYFVLIERPDGSFMHYGERVSGDLIDSDYGNLDDFITQYCLRKIIGDIISEVSRANLDKDVSIALANCSISLNEVEKDFLIYISYRDRSQLEWLKRVARTHEVFQAIRPYFYISLEHTKIE